MVITTLMTAIRRYKLQTADETPAFIIVHPVFFIKLQQEESVRAKSEMLRLIDYTSEGARFTGIPLLESAFVDSFELLDAVVLR